MQQSRGAAPARVAGGRSTLRAAMLFCPSLFLFCISSHGQAAAGLPDAPEPQEFVHVKPAAERCEYWRAGAALGVAVSNAAAVATGFDPQPAGLLPNCPSRMPLINWYSRFITGPQVKPMTPREKAWLAVRDVGDPFNIITILGESAISVAANSHSAYGPGMKGWGHYVGDSFAQDMTGEFFGTFVIPSLVGQDPHYHRMPDRPIKRRVFHAVAQVVWTQGDSGRNMPNYANLAGFAIDDEIANLYVPGRSTDAASTATRYGTALATAPIGNFVDEFLPDVASRIHIQIVVIQRIINHVATNASTGTNQ